MLAMSAANPAEGYLAPDPTSTVPKYYPCEMDKETNYPMAGLVIAPSY